MEIAVKKSSDEEFDYFIRQRNLSPSAEPEGRLTLLGETILVWVPSNLPGVVAQTDERAWSNLIRSYHESIRMVVELGGKSVCVVPLGTESVMWRQPQSALAARKAVESLVDIGCDLRVVFLVSELDYAAWDDIMRF